ncbi:YihY/virulence factor BrkB family protein [Dysgonomonas sp. 25]|uniref:YihY/virulence factor BrkB family protein n=1 Tax=Dysgonomonas sp. 25 TaxID=2302933 RepID=UPI0013D6FFD7|nr:YihY/virulence factor BrkB family protein [Dysgonomonas sp. 25]NDV69071.1 YihY/virulence factor BrkB family protein [Dysgonomonas sp. 25]
MIEKITNFIKKIIRFLTHDIWRFTGDELSARRMSLYNIIKSFVLVIRNIDSSEINTRAAALTYKTLLSIVPLLAVLFGIARGFGIQGVVETELKKYFEGQVDMIDRVMGFIDSSLEYAKGGVFLGVGIIMLLYTVVSLLGSIEDNFNTIWRIKKGRSYYRQFTDYLALFIIAPVFLVCNAGLSIVLNMTTEFELVDFVLSPVIKLLPVAITIMLFTFLYSYIPNTKVKFSAAFLAGIVSGLAFQGFQWLYISGQIWISKYNAIYGSFAALPLLLLWMQLSWFIFLIGVELSFAYQNVSKFSFEHETKNISRRYKDFILLAVSSIIVKRFADGEKAITADEISTTYKIPTTLMSDVIYYLQNIGIIIETPSDDNGLIPAYVPALDINKLSVSYLIEKMNLYGSEDFVIDKEGALKGVWNQMIKMQDILMAAEKDTLIKDL